MMLDMFGKVISAYKSLRAQVAPEGPTQADHKNAMELKRDYVACYVYWTFDWRWQHKLDRLSPLVPFSYGLIYGLVYDLIKMTINKNEILNHFFFVFDAILLILNKVSESFWRLVEDFRIFQVTLQKSDAFWYRVG